MTISLCHTCEFLINFLSSNTKSNSILLFCRIFKYRLLEIDALVGLQKFFKQNQKVFYFIFLSYI